MTPEQRELKTCPFCGGAARIESNRDWHCLYADHDEDCALYDANDLLMFPAQPGYLKEIADLWNRRAQVEVLTVPQWVSVEDRLPAPGVLVMVWQPRQEWNYPDDLLISFDCIDPDDDDAATWRGHNNWYEEYCVIGKPEGSTGPSQDAPYTHWKPMDAAPTIPTIPGTKEGA